MISPNLIGDVTWYELGEARETLALLHEEYARAQARLGSRFIGLCMLPLQDTAAAIETLDHAIVELGLRGVLMNVAPAGRSLVSELTLPVFERIEQLGVPIFLHPANRSLVWDFAAPFGRLAESGLGWMFDTSLAALSLITSGTLDRFPRARRRPSARRRNAPVRRRAPARDGAPTPAPPVASSGRSPSTSASASTSTRRCRRAARSSWRASSTASSGSCSAPTIRSTCARA